MNKVATVDLKGNEYALVPVRLKAFREQNPRADIISTPHWGADGSLDFETRIIKDQAEEHGAKGTGWAHYSSTEMKNSKSYEKLSTISVGRALSNLGYLNNGQIASTEEMEEFEDYKKTKQDDREYDILSDIKACESLDDLKEFFMGLNGKDKTKAVIEAKDKRKEELSK